MKTAEGKSEPILCYICGRTNNLTLSPERIDGEWQSICWPCENIMIMSISRYRLQINTDIFAGHVNLLT